MKMKRLAVAAFVATITMGSVFTSAAWAADVVDTGQSGCYDSDGVALSPWPSPGEPFYGQDAQFDGTQFSFQDNGDGTVTDLNTGLMWQQTPSSQSFNWQEAVDYCDTLTFAGHSDWRIPSAKEQFSISDFSQGWPYLDTTYFDIVGPGVSKDEQYWVSDYYAGTTHGGAPSAFGVNHGTGHIKAYPAGAGGPMGNYVRAVRGDSYGTNDFVDNGDGTVTDLATGLMWQQDDSVDGLDWGTSLSYAENLLLAGYADWRLPNVKELQSIVDYSRAPNATNPANVGPSIDTDFFNVTPLEPGTTMTEPDYGYYWSNTNAYFNPMSPGFYYAWYVAFGTAVGPTGEDTHGAGAVRFDTKVEGGPAGEDPERIYNMVRCVRDFSGATTWTDLEQGLAGTHGIPVNVGDGTLIGGDPVANTLSDALENSMAYFVWSSATLQVPFQGGIMVPDPLPPNGILLPLITDPTGVVGLSDTWPMGIPSGTSFYIQWWVVDSTGPYGFSASNAISGTTP